MGYFDSQVSFFANFMHLAPAVSEAASAATLGQCCSTHPLKLQQSCKTYSPLFQPLLTEDLQDKTWLIFNSYISRSSSGQSSSIGPRSGRPRAGSPPGSSGGEWHPAPLLGSTAAPPTPSPASRPLLALLLLILILLISPLLPQAKMAHLPQPPALAPN